MSIACRFVIARSGILLALLIWIGCQAGGLEDARAQSWPERVVRIVSPFPAGGGSDLLARVVAQSLQESLGRPFVVENRVGAGGNIGMDHVAHSVPDGYTLALANNTVTINLSWGGQPFDAVRDLTAIVLVGSTPPMIGASAGFALRSLPELVAWARAHPGEVSYASCGTGTAHHFAAELLQSMARIRMTHVPYKGCSQAIPDVLNGSVPVVFSTVSNLAPHVKSGKIRGYATTGTTRAQSAPEFPTVAELGYPGYAVDTWFGLMGPAGLPRDVVMRLNSEVNRALGRTEIRERLAAQYFEPLGGSSQRFGELVQQELRTYGALVREAGIKAD